MMLLNQRTWAHHAAVLLPGTVAVWYAIAYGRMRTRARATALGLLLGGGLLLFATAGEAMVALGKAVGAADPDLFADRMMAYGPDFYFFLAVFVAALICARALRRSPDPYADERQPLRTGS